MATEPVKVIIRHVNERGQFAMNDDGSEWVVAFPFEPDDWIKAFARKKDAVEWCRQCGYKIVKEQKV